MKREKGLTRLSVEGNKVRKLRYCVIKSWSSFKDSNYGSFENVRFTILMIII